MMRSVLSTLLVCAAAWATIVTTARASTKKVLVLVDDLAAKQTHSTFLKQLAFGGYDVTLSLASSEDAFLQKVDEWQYDHLVVLGGEGKFGEGVAPAKLLEFFESGRNVYLAINPETSGKARALAKRLGADVEAKRSTVVDPFSSEGSSVKAVVDEAAVDRLLPGVVESGSDVVFVDGIGFSIAPEATMTVGALHATPTAYATTDGAMDGAKRPTKLGGYSLKLAALVQGRNNARAAVVGSTAMLSDAVLGQGAHKANVAFMKDSLSWVFGERGVLTSSEIRHKHVDSDLWNPSEGYRVKDEVEVYVDVFECTKGACGPYGGNDVQIELRMLDPYVRKTLSNTGNGTFSARIKVPDVYGVFKFQVDYKRPGLSWVERETVVPIRPFRHDEYARFLSQAFPYYASVLSMGLGFLAVGKAFVLGGGGDS